MSPILKRDFSEHARQARRLAALITGDPPPLDPLDQASNSLSTHSQDIELEPTRAYVTSASPRPMEEDDPGPSKLLHVSREGRRDKGKWKASDEIPPHVGLGIRVSHGLGNEDVDDDGETDHMLSNGHSMEGTVDKASGVTKLRDLSSLLFEATPSLLISLVGLVFTGELLEHLARWTVFRRVDELFILVPMVGNLNGNIEMCLSARLGTSANIGELDKRHTRRGLLLANLTLLCLQALLISAIAGFLSFLLGLATVHRLGDTPPVGTSGNQTLVEEGDPGLAVGEQDFREGYTRPGWQQLTMVLATGMCSAGISAAVLGSFMSSVVVISRWAGVDPGKSNSPCNGKMLYADMVDNITPPVASCGGDLLTLFILALLGSALVGTMNTPLPLIAVVVMVVAAAWFTKRVMRNEWVKNIAKGGWAPLIGAMLISSGTGMVLDRGVSKYRGFALLAISMTGLTGSIGAIHANRLSTSLHTRLHPLHPSASSHSPPRGLSALQGGTTLFFLAFPCLACFLFFVDWAGWIDLSLGWAGWVSYALTTGISLCIAHGLTLYFWSRDLDPE
ncbi:hypothetical protein M231_06444 [Tremella mesenterica]|uniref:SLC41A/MgtE integral membrane domain-containing protein n=1 Tax=Tremella mesenterica TaxID=5217 RepID=A0A4Q1BBV2_TREME|nr:hypothetical protein M231_06444 [Tremella mesenterica]